MGAEKMQIAKKETGKYLYMICALSIRIREIPATLRRGYEATPALISLSFPLSGLFLTNPHRKRWQWQLQTFIQIDV